MPKICVFVSVNVHVRILHEKHQNRRKSLKRARDLEKRQRSYQEIISLEEKPKNDLNSTKVQKMTKTKVLFKPLEAESTSILQVTSSYFKYLVYLVAFVIVYECGAPNVKV